MLAGGLDRSRMIIEAMKSRMRKRLRRARGAMYYCSSTTVCCAHSLSEEIGLALGAQAGPARLGHVFHRAGFGQFRVAQENPFNLILEARP